MKKTRLQSNRLRGTQQSWVALAIGATVLQILLAGCTTPNTQTSSPPATPPPQQNPVPQPTPVPEPAPVSEPTPVSQPIKDTQPTPGFNRYTNSEYNFQFLYPIEFDSKDISGYASLKEKVIDFGLTSKAYPKTNFSDAVFSVSAQPAKSIDECLTANLPEGITKFKTKQTINDIEFYTADGMGAAAGNRYDVRAYRTLMDTNCIEAIETIHTTNIGNYDPGTVTEIDKAPIWKKLEDIMSTFQKYEE